MGGALPAAMTPRRTRKLAQWLRALSLNVRAGLGLQAAVLQEIASFPTGPQVLEGGVVEGPDCACAFEHPSRAGGEMTRRAMASR